MKKFPVPPSTEVGGTVFTLDIMMDILSRSPTKSLMRFKCVNRKWGWLIKDKYFVSKLHLPRMKNENQVGYVLQTQYGFYPLGYIPYEPDLDVNSRIVSQYESFLCVIASCNGLLLECNTYDEFMLKNPLSGISIQISTPKIVFPDNCTYGAAFFGMGYNKDNDEYKVVRVVGFRNPVKSSAVHVLSTNIMNWEYLGEFLYENPVRTPGISVGGRVNWQILDGNTTIGIATFCCKTNAFGKIDMPNGMEIIQVYGEIGSLDDDRLVLFSSVCLSFTGYELWILERYGDASSWRRINFPHGGVVNDGERALAIQPLRLMKPDNKEFLFRIEPLDEFVMYNLDSRTYRPINAPILDETYCTIFPFVQSTVCPCRLTEYG